jgi:hypothetical protein
MKREPSPDDLENRIARLLGELPDRRAPRSLEQRVLSEVARREAQPWWRKSWSHWPLLVRAGFVLASGGAAGMTVAFAIFGVQGLSALMPRVQETVASLQSFGAVVSAVGAAFADAASAMPGYLLWLPLGGIVTAYALLVAVCTLIYRLLRGSSELNFSL